MGKTWTVSKPQQWSDVSDISLLCLNNRLGAAGGWSLSGCTGAGELTHSRAAPTDQGVYSPGCFPSPTLA